jgi:hypothetical protein
MKNDYLWEKKGSDAEIERLERLLSGFRYSEAAEAASNVVKFPSKAKRSVQPWIFAMAASVAIGAVALTAWNLSSEPTSVQTAVNIEAAVDHEPRISTVAAQKDEPKAIIQTPEPAITTKKPRALQKRKHTAAVRKQKDRRETPALTNEERYAYGQLMLALSITSSKWQVVQDSINGVEDDRTNDR